ncbi:MAG: BON domain-containing protein [Bryobacterales bacterium]|nr:BON domain-containing protein [Bryobacterales bacterium]
MNRRSWIIAGGALLLERLSAQAPVADPRSREALIRVAEKIRKKLVMLSAYSVFDAISFNMEPSPGGYKVTLLGFVSKPSLKDSASRALKGVEEIENVVNQIEVLPLSRHDENIRTAVYLKIYYHPSLSRYNPNRGAPVYGSPMGWRRAQAIGISNDPPPGIHPVSIIVRNGEVTLMGQVDNDMDKQLAGMLANQVSGVFKVTNGLTTVQKPKAK